MACLRGLDGNRGGIQIANFPTITNIGVLAQNERKAAAKSNPTFGVDVHLLIPSKLISTGSSAVEILVPSTFKIFKPYKAIRFC